MRSPWIPASSLAVGAFLWHFSYARYGLVPQDEGWLLHAATRVSQGEVPYRDFLTAYVPGRYYLVAAVLESFGSNLPAVRILFCVLRAAVVVLTFLLGARIGSPAAAVAAALTVAVLPGPWHKTFYTLVPLLAFAPLLRWERQPAARWLAVAGVIAGVGLWFRQDAALAGAAGIALAIGLVSRRRAADLGVFGASAAGVAVLPLGAFALAGVTPAEILRQSGGAAVALGTPAAEILGQVLRFHLQDYGTPHRFLLPVLALAAVFVAATALGVGVRRRRPGDALLAGIGLTALLLANQLFRDYLLIRFLQLGALTYLLFFALAARASRPVRVVVGVVPVALAAYVMLSDDNRQTQIEYTGTVAVRARPTVPLEVRGHTFHVAATLGRELGELVEFLDGATAPGEPIVVLGRPAIAYFMTDRPNPTTRIRFGEEHRGELDAEWMRRVRNEGCRWVIVPRGWMSRLWLPELLPPGARRSAPTRIGGWTLWAIA